MKKISTPKAPLPRGHYSQGIIHNGLIYVSGQMPVDSNTGEKILGSIEEQTEQVLKNVKVILHGFQIEMEAIGTIPTAGRPE